MKAKLLFYILLCALVSLTGCGGGAANNPENNTHDMISFDGQIINVGEPNQLESPVMIFEAYMSGSYFSGSNYAPYLNGYVILYNSGNETVDLNGYSVVVGEDDGTVLSERTVSLSGSIDPGSFFVVEGGPTTDASPDVPSGEALPFEINISANNFIPKRKSGVIALYGGTFGESISPGDENIIDFLAYGNVKSGAFPEEALAPEPSVKRILRRLNFTNTYNNIVDFDRVNIVDNPSGILRFSPDLTAANVIAMGPLTKAEISLSHVSGFYQQELALMVNTTLAGNVKIYYTLDGSNPVSPVGTVSSSAIEYDGAIRIFDRSNEPPVLAPLTITTPDENYHSWPPIKNDRETEAEYEKRIEELFSGKYKGTTIKVAAIDDEHVATKVVSGSYYINNGSPGQRFGMPAISIIADQDSLFNPDTGIFMFKNLRGETASSTSVVVHYFDEDGRLGFTDNSMRFRLHGGGSRRFPQKSFRLYPSGDNLEFDLFNGRARNSEGEAITNFGRFILRMGGQDRNWGGIRDEFWQSFCGQLGTFSYQAQRPVATFLNGEYWGTYFFTEFQDDYYISSHFNIRRKDVVMLDSFVELRIGDWDSQKEVYDLREFIINNDMSVGENYRHFTALFDVESYIDLFICEIFGGDNDWPHNNVRMWKSINPNDTEYQKWRMIMCDTDPVFNLTYNEDIHTFLNYILTYDGDYSENARMFSSLMDNAEFKNQFISRSEYLLDNFFVLEDMMAAYMGFHDEVETAFAEHSERWGLNSRHFEGSSKDLEAIMKERIVSYRAEIEKIK